MTKVFATLLKWASSPFFIGLLISLLLGYLANFYYASYRDPQLVESYPILQEIERLHNQTVDLRLRQRGPRKGSDDIAILTIDEMAIQKYGRWPWPRKYIAEVVDDVMSNGARSLSFDIIFSEKEEDVLKSLEQVKEKLKQKLPEQSERIEQIIQQEKLLRDHDKSLTAVIEKHAEKLIMGAMYDEFEYIPYPVQDACYLNISKKNQVFDYWEKEAFLIGVQNEDEVKLPPTWNRIIQEHFQGLQEDAAHRWLIKNVDHPATRLLQSKGYPAESEETARLTTQYLLGNINQSDSPSIRNVGAELDAKWPHHSRIDVLDAMNEALDGYCLRYLTEKDELKPTFSAHWPQIVSEYDKFAGTTFQDGITYIKIKTRENPVHHVYRWIFNIPPIAAVTEHTGTFNATQDKDGSIRRASLFVRTGSLFIPSLAFKTYLAINEYYPTATLLPNPYENPAESDIITNVEIKNSEDQHVLTIPTDHRGQLPINYAGPQKMFSYLSASEILDGKDPLTITQRVANERGEWVEEKIEVDKKEYLKNKSLIFGATATGIYDLRVTPFEKNFPGVETHANLLDNLMRQDYLKTSTKEEYFMPIIVILLGLTFSFVVAQFGAIVGLIITALSLISIYLFDSLFMFSKGTVVTILFPIFTIFFLYTFLTFFKYFTEERKKKQLKGTFQKYVSPEIVNEILKDPSKLELGGLKQEMSVFFSDIRGFTTISEKLDPKALSDLLNDYLTPMTEIVFKNSGTLDKYMGDAIMAFFGAPLHSEKHAAQACRAAIQQIDKLFELQKNYVARGLPVIDIGIGINTGEMSVGNMGSQTVRNYTVMGDSVNLGSRLESINKEYGTRIIISEFTRKQISEDEFFFREIDWVKVKGKNEPVKIFELIGEGKPNEEKKKKVSHFNHGFLLYHQRQWEQAIAEFNLALSYDAGDQPSQLYIKRCQGYMKEAPDENWDGVFTMTSK